MRKALKYPFFCKRMGIDLPVTIAHAEWGLRHRELSLHSFILLGCFTCCSGNDDTRLATGFISRDFPAEWSLFKVTTLKSAHSEEAYNT